MTHLFKDRNVYISTQTQSEGIFFGGRRDWWIRDLGSSLTLQYHPVQFTDLGNFHRAHESLANTLLTLPSSLEVIDLEHLSFYTLRLGIQQGFSRKTKKPQLHFSESTRNFLIEAFHLAGMCNQQKSCHFPTDSGDTWKPGGCLLQWVFSLYASGVIRCGCSVAHQVDLPQKLQEAALLSNGETCSSPGLWFVNCLQLHGG